MQNYIIITGSFSDGFTFYGPFSRVTEATDWAEQWLPRQEWWLDSLLPPQYGTALERSE